ncbi:MAG: O-antigen polymerase [Microviridae sp.]|nr:MAG: O-antigen polymerase [Microviridae sp.]
MQSCASYFWLWIHIFVVYKFGITFALIFLLPSIFTAICAQKFCASSLVSANMWLNLLGSMYVVKSAICGKSTGATPTYFVSYRLFSTMNICWFCSAKFPRTLLTLVM